MSSASTLAKPKRNYGIDLLRMLCMLMIAVLHTMGHGGVLNAAKGDPLALRLVWLLEIACYGAVNCYALISGFVGGASKFKLTNLFKLWLQVVFYSVLLTVFAGILSPDGVSGETILRAFFPVLNKQYWYFSAYFGMFLLTPILGAAVRNLPRKQLGLILVLMIAFYSVLPIVLSSAPIGWKIPDIFGIGSGYTTFWLAILYLCGAYLAKYQPMKKLPRRSGVLIWGVCVLFSFAAKFFFDSGVWVNYHSPSILLGSVALFHAFSGWNLEKAERVIRFAAPLSFGVYLIHDHPLMRRLFISGRFAHFTSFHPILIPLAVLLVAICIYLACTLIEWGRASLFKLMRVDQGMKRLEDALQEKLSEETKE